MSQAPSNNNNQQAQARAQAQQEQQAKNDAQAKAFQKAETPSNAGSGYGAGRTTFDKSGNTLQDGKIVQFAGRQSQENYLADRGYGNNGIILDQSKASKADFSSLQQANISGVVNAEQPLGGFGWNWGGNISGNKQISRGSPLEKQIQDSEASRSAIIYSNFDNPDYATGGKKSSDKTVVSLDKAQAFFGKTPDNQYGWHDIGKDQLVRDSAKEKQVKQSEAEKAFTSSPSKSNASYITGGIPEKTSGGVITSKSLGKNSGWNILAPDQLTRNSPKEEQIKQSEASKATVFTSQRNNKEYDAFTSTEEGKSQILDFAKTNSQNNLITFDNKLIDYQNNKIEEQNAQNALGNGLISLSNQQARAKNVKSENDFKSYLTEGEKQGATFSFFSGNKKVGESSGPRTYYDFLSARQKYGDVSVSESFLGREKELTNAVQKNTAFYSSLPQSYWDALSKSGYISENNAGKINDVLNLNAKIQNRESLANVYGFARDIIGTKYQNNPITGKTPYKQEYNRDLITGKLSDINSENEISSFLKTPFVGKKLSTSTVPSTSFANVLQFAPGLGNKEIDLASRGLEKLVFEKAGPALTGAKETVVGKVRGVVANRVLYESPFLNTPKERPTLEKTPFRERATYRPTNPTREQLPSDILSKDTAFGETPVSARQNTPRNTMFEDISKETQAKNTKIQNDLLTPRQPDTNPPASRNIPFFAGRKDVLGRLFTSNVAPVKTVKKPVPTSQASVTGLTSSASPINTNTQPNSNLSPISRESYGVNFIGSYPESYLPPAAGQISSSSARNVESDIFYRPARKTRDIDLGFGEQPKESVSASPELIGARKNLVKENQSIFLSRTQNDLLVPTKKQEIKIISEKAPEETNILGRRGKPPVKSSNPLDITQTPRSEFVERGNIRPENEVFTNRGQKIKNEYGDVLFGDLTKPQGALRSSPKSVKSSRPIIDLEPQKEYQDWRFQKFASKGPFNYGFRTGKPPKEVNLEERKDYQDWRFSKFLEKNPQPEKVGDIRFQSFVDAKLPKVNKKAPVYSGFYKESKAKVPKSSSAKLFETKPKEESKGTEFKNIGSKQETVLIQKPLQKRRLVSSQEQQYESSYEFRPVPTSKSESTSILGLKSEVLPRFATKTGSKQESGSMISNMFKNLEKSRIGPKSGLKSNQGLGLAFRQTPKQGTRQTPDLITSPKQSTKPKQTTTQAPKFPNPKVSKSIFKFSEKPLQAQRVKTTNEHPKPPKALLPVLFGPVGRKPRGKNSSGPTALYQLSVRNIFASSLDINPGKNRVEF